MDLPVHRTIHVESMWLRPAAGDFEHIVTQVDQIEEAHSRLQMPLGMRLLGVAPGVAGVYQGAVLKSDIQSIEKIKF